MDEVQRVLLIRDLQLARASLAKATDYLYLDDTQEAHDHAGAAIRFIDRFRQRLRNGETPPSRSADDLPADRGTRNTHA